MAKGRKVTYQFDVDESGAVLGARKVEQSFDDVDKKAGKLGKTTSSLTDRLTSVGAVAGGAAAAGLGLALSQAMTRSIKKGRQFESQLAELEAITGITGDRLQRLGDRSLQLSKKYGSAASDIVEANKLVASQLAEKIDFNTEQGFRQLQQISEQATILQKAAGIQLKEAVETTTSVINQFNLSADESGRVINTLAAGAKYGAAEVPAIGRALVNAGAAAYGAGQSIEQTNAAIQVLAANGQVGERAGTALRAIFTRLKTESQALAEAGIKNVNIEADGLSATLRKLEPLLEDTTAAKKIFGEEALNQIQILIRETDAVENLTGKVTDTQIAHEQAAVNMDTFDGAVKQMTQTLDSELIKAFQESNGALVKLVKTTTWAIERTAYAVRVINDWADEYSDLRDKMDLATHGTNAQVEAMRSLRNELAKAAQESSLTAEEENKLREAYESTNKALKNRASSLWDNTYNMKERRKELKKELEQLKNNIGFEDYIPGPFANRFDSIARLEKELGSLNVKIDANEGRLQKLKKALDEGSISFEEFIQKVRESAEAQEDSNDAANEQQEKQQTLADTLKEKKKQLDTLLTSEKNLTGTTWEKAKALQQEITKTQDLIKLRKKYIEQAANQVLSSVSIGGDKTQLGNIGGKPGDTISEDEIKKNVEQSEKQAEMDAWAAGLEKVKSKYDTVAEAAQIAGDKSEKGGKKGASAYSKVAEHALAAATAQIAMADSAEEAANRVIDTIISEIVAYAIRSAMSSLPFPANILAAAGAAAAGKGLSALIPEFGLGGIASGPSHEQGGILGMIGGKPALELEGGEAIINKRSTKMFANELSAINQAGGGVPLAKEGALTLNSVGRSSSPVPQANGGFDTSAIAAAVKDGIESANVVAVMQDSLEDLSERLNDLEEYNNRYNP